MVDRLCKLLPVGLLDRTILEWTAESQIAISAVPCSRLAKSRLAGLIRPILPIRWSKRYICPNLGGTCR
jgi:hypothetical protein